MSGRRRVVPANTGPWIMELVAMLEDNVIRDWLVVCQRNLLDLANDLQQAEDVDGILQ